MQWLSRPTFFQVHGPKIEAIENRSFFVALILENCIIAVAKKIVLLKHLKTTGLKLPISFIKYFKRTFLTEMQVFENTLKIKKIFVSLNFSHYCDNFLVVTVTKQPQAYF